MPLDLEFFSCLQCGMVYRIADLQAGTKFACTKCACELTVPRPPKGSEDSTLNRNVKDLKQAIEEERRKSGAVVIKTGKRKKK